MLSLQQEASRSAEELSEYSANALDHAQQSQSTLEALESLVRVMDEITRLNQEIYQAAQKQQSISDDIHSINASAAELGEQSAASMAELTDAAQKLREDASVVADSIRGYRH